MLALLPSRAAVGTYSNRIFLRSRAGLKYHVHPSPKFKGRRKVPTLSNKDHHFAFAFLTSSISSIPDHIIVFQSL